MAHLFFFSPCSSATGRLITAKDHASVQLNIGEVDANGIYTGEYDDYVTKNKAQALSAFAVKHDVDLSGSIALGDSVQDSDMLNLVGYPIAIHPTIELYRFCAMNRIPIIHEKRALIYIDTWERDTKRRVEADFEDIFPSPVSEILKTRLRSQQFLP